LKVNVYGRQNFDLACSQKDSAIAGVFYCLNNP